MARDRCLPSGEEFVDVTDGEFSKPFACEVWQDVHPHHGLVVAKGAGRDLVAHNVVKPSIKRLSHLDVLIFEQQPIVELSA